MTTERVDSDGMTTVVTEPRAMRRDERGPAVLAVGLQKRFGDKAAVAGVDLKVERGAFFGLVGPNGAGKTTTLRMITCLLRPDAGSATVDGLDVWADPTAAKARFGVLPDDLRLFERLTGREFLFNR